MERTKKEKLLEKLCQMLLTSYSIKLFFFSGFVIRMPWDLWCLLVLLLIFILKLYVRKHTTTCKIEKYECSMALDIIFIALFLIIIYFNFFILNDLNFIMGEILRIEFLDLEIQKVDWDRSEVLNLCNDFKDVTDNKITEKDIVKLIDQMRHPLRVMKLMEEHRRFFEFIKRYNNRD